MAGPNPYKLYSFKEWRMMFGPLFVVCDPCRRFTGISMAEHGQRDSRDTRFKCQRFGGPGRATHDKPGGDYHSGDAKP